MLKTEKKTYSNKKKYIQFFPFQIGRHKCFKTFNTEARKYILLRWSCILFCLTFVFTSLLYFGSEKFSTKYIQMRCISRNPVKMDNRLNSLTFTKEHVFQPNKKITECWLANEENIFFLILLREEGKITRSRLVLRSPSNSSFNREVVFLQQWRLVSR